MTKPYYIGDHVVLNGWCDNQGKKITKHCGIVGMVISTKRTKASQYVIGISHDNFIKMFTDDKGYMLKDTPEAWRDTYLFEISEACKSRNMYPIECSDCELVSLKEYTDKVQQAFQYLYEVFNNLCEE